MTKRTQTQAEQPNAPFAVLHKYMMWNPNLHLFLDTRFVFQVKTTPESGLLGVSPDKSQPCKYLHFIYMCVSMFGSLLFLFLFVGQNVG